MIETLFVNCMDEDDDIFSLEMDTNGRAYLSMTHTPEDLTFVLGKDSLREIARWCDAAANAMEDAEAGE